MARGAGSSLGSHGTRLTLCSGPATAALGAWLSTVALLSWEARMAGFSLEARGSHESGRASRTRVPPQARFAILPIQTIQTGGALNPGRSWWSRGTRQT